MQKVFKPALSVLLTLVFVFAIVITAMPTAYATTQSEIDALKAQQAEIQSQQAQVQSTINSLKGQQSAYLSQKAALDQQCALTVQQISNLNEQLELNEKLIAQKTKEVEEAQVVADKQLEKFKKRIRIMEENGKYNYLEVLFGASSIGEFLSLMDDIGDIMQSDKALEDAYRQAVADLKTAKKECEDAQVEMLDKKAELVVLNDQLQSQIGQIAALVNALQSDINANAEVLAQIKAEDAQVESMIQAKVSQLNAQQSQNSGSSSGGSSSSGSSSSGSGGLIWPSNSTYITSVQGPRTHPISGEYRNHGGTDIGASYGSPIYAAAGGTVVTAYNDGGYNGGYGNYVMIDHGNGMQTLYAHMSSTAVSVGQHVSQGQVIGYVGSTGASTGPHLHYEVYEGGSRQNPENYYSGGFSYAPDA